MIKVSELKRHGIEVVAGDVVSECNIIINLPFANPSAAYDNYEIEEFAWRPVTGKQPVNDDVVVDLKMQTDHLGGEFIYEGYVWNDKSVKHRQFIFHWRPSMAWLMEQALIFPSDIEKAWKDPVPYSKKLIEELHVKMDEIFTPTMISTRKVNVVITDTEEIQNMAMTYDRGECNLDKDIASIFNTDGFITEPKEHKKTRNVDILSSMQWLLEQEAKNKQEDEMIESCNLDKDIASVKEGEKVKPVVGNKYKYSIMGTSYCSDDIQSRDTCELLDIGETGFTYSRGEGEVLYSEKGRIEFYEIDAEEGDDMSNNEKLVFTIEMVGTGRYEFLDCSDGEMLNNDWFEFEVVIVKDNILFGFGILDEDRVPDAFDGRHHTFRKIQTEREKAIESIIDVLSGHETDVTELVKNRDTFKGAAQAIYDAGYSKS